MLKSAIEHFSSLINKQQIFNHYKAWYIKQHTRWEAGECNEQFEYKSASEYQKVCQIQDIKQWIH